MRLSRFAINLILIISSSFLNVPSQVFAEPANLSLAKKNVQIYHDSGVYSQELTAAINQAHRYILQQVEANKQKHNRQKLAVVLDIDETSITNYNKMVKRDFVGNRQQIHEEIMAADSPAIRPMLELYQDAVKHGVKVFFVTGRDVSELEATKTNLIRAGYKDWSGLYLRPMDYHDASIIPFKTRTRALISKKGYTIIASIGDQYSDLIGGFAKKAFKLPNPFYFLP
ncbi:HAD family acid phosphatase [Legionella spiritensis]|uniref:Acid phosphatase, class B n=1 Tax=Legionella spiritensis TaxID=452 RepID=A0A0W0ZAH0_LEGSP|nr:HAD family acid phosphatase [Legionella spiritensis]KTD66133.1 acid phosphatase, class B [Legionella spiritensis]SNV44007.1 acid phosphatase, class B [Legionella spiritensis]